MLLIVLKILLMAFLLSAQPPKIELQTEPVTASMVENLWPSAMVFVRYGSFWPNEKIFKTVYGSGPVYGGELRLHVKSAFYLSLEAGYFKKTGELTITREPTTMAIFPIDAMVVFHALSGNIMPYMGAGTAVCQYTEKNVIGKVNKRGYGLAICAGVTGRWRSIGIDARVKYDSVKVKPLENDVNLGGLTLSIAAGYVF